MLTQAEMKLGATVIQCKDKLSLDEALNSNNTEIAGVILPGKDFKDLGGTELISRLREMRIPFVISTAGVDQYVKPLIDEGIICTDEVVDKIGDGVRNKLVNCFTIET